MTRHGANLLGVGLAALFVGACGDDASGAGSASASVGATGGTGADATASGTDGTDASGGPVSGSTSDSGAAGSTGPGSEGGTTTDGGDGSSGTSGNNENCEAPGDLVPCDAQTRDPFQAIGLDCPGNPNQAIPVANESFTSPDADAWKIARQFGDALDDNDEPVFGAREGEQFLIISSGHLDDPDVQGVISMSAGAHEIGIDNGNPDLGNLPAPMVPDVGSKNGNGGTPFMNCDDVGDCSDSLETQWNAGGSETNDLLWFQFEVDVPGGTHGFSFDFAYFSAEFPEWVDTTYNDIFVVWSNSEAYTGNLCFVNAEPCTVTALWPVDYTELSPELVGTGFDGVGGGTDWYNAKASASPGETLQLTWAVFDMGDSVWDTAVIIDNWRWDCEGCVPSEVHGCGIGPT